MKFESYVLFIVFCISFFFVNNGVWYYASDIKPEIFGLDEGLPEDYIFKNPVNVQNNFFVTSGKVGIGTINPSVDFEVAGNAKITNLDVSKSLKKNGIEVLNSNEVSAKIAEEAPSTQSVNLNNYVTKDQFPKNIGWNEKYVNTYTSANPTTEVQQGVTGCVLIKIDCTDATTSYCTIKWNAIGVNAGAFSSYSGKGTSDLNKGGIVTSPEHMYNGSFGTNYYSCTVKWDAATNKIYTYGKQRHFLAPASYIQCPGVSTSPVWCEI